jgi:hypothetical protein
MGELKLINSKAVFIECDISVYKQVESAMTGTTLEIDGGYLAQ